MNGAVNIHLQATGAQPAAAQVNAVAGSMAALHGAQTRTTGSNRNLGNALLQASRGLQDMQYGLAGAVNNLEGIASSLGLGAGVAGVVTVLAVAVQQLGPKVIDMLKSFDGAAQVRDSISAMQEQLGKVEPVNAATKAGERYKEQLDAEKQALKAANDQIDNQLKLLALQSAAKKSAAAFELEQGIQDIQAQRLPKEQELALIAERRIRFAEEEKARQDALAAAQAKVREESLSKSISGAQSMAAELVRLDTMIERTSRLNDLLTLQSKLVDEVAAFASPTAVEAEGLNDPAANQRRADAAASLAANKEAVASLVAQGGIGELGALQEQRAVLLPTAKDALSAARDAQIQAEAQAAKEQEESRERAAELERERQRIARSVTGGVLGPNLVAPGVPLGVQSLPVGAAGGLVPSPLGVQGLPAAGRFASAPPNPLGGDALPQLNNATEATNAAANESAKTNAAVVDFATAQAEEMERLRKDAADTRAQLEALKAQVKNARR